LLGFSGRVPIDDGSIGRTTTKVGDQMLGCGISESHFRKPTIRIFVRLCVPLLQI